jgi:hypothetical protein
MKGLSICRQVNIEDIADLTPRRGIVTVRVKLNRHPHLEEIDQRIGLEVDLLTILEQSLDKLEQDFFQDIAIDASIEEAGSFTDPTWLPIPQDSGAISANQSNEYEALLRRFAVQPE